MLKYFLIFTSIGIIIGKIPKFGAALFYIGLITLFWWNQTEFVWGLAAMAELVLGYYIGRALFGAKQTAHNSGGVNYSKNEPNLNQRPSQEHEILSGSEESSLGLASLIKFRAKALAVIELDLDYYVDTPGQHQASFNHVTKSALQLGVNEFGAAIGFVLLQMKGLARPLSPEDKEIVIKNLKKSMTLVPKSNDSIMLMRDYITWHRGDFDEEMLSRSGLEFVSEILNENSDILSGHTNNISFFERRLSELMTLREKGLISQEQYDVKSNEIIRAL